MNPLWNELLSHGTKTEDALTLRQGFSLELTGYAAECLQVSACCRFSGECEPHVRFCLKAGEETIYVSPDYVPGVRSGYSLRQWRIPPMIHPDMRAEMCFDVPEGTCVFLRSCSIASQHPAPEWHGGLRHNAHLGFLGMAPGCTMPAFELAAACGFPACIVVPKVTKDGVLVCIHDDTINATARNAQDLPPEAPMRVDEMTLSELQTWDYRGKYSRRVYGGTSIPLLEDFFTLCGKTGMRPMFSTHPALTVEQWKSVKAMLLRRGLLSRFHIKSFSLDILETAYSVFGDGIDGYTWDNGDVERFSCSALANANCRLGVEHAYSKITEESVRKILDAGFFAAVWALPRITSEDYRRLIAWGVTEFTEDHHCSMGLNW